MSYYDGNCMGCGSLLSFRSFENNVCEVFNGHLVWFIHQYFSEYFGVSRCLKYSKVGVYCSSSTDCLNCEEVDFPILLLEGFYEGLYLSKNSWTRFPQNPVTIVGESYESDCGCQCGGERGYGIFGEAHGVCDFPVLVLLGLSIYELGMCMVRARVGWCYLDWCSHWY